MKVEYSPQYRCNAVVLDGTESPAEVIRECICVGAHHYECEDEDVCLVLQFPGRPPELYTKEAMIRSLPYKPVPVA